MRGSKERKTITLGLIASSFLILSPSKQESMLLRGFLFVIKIIEPNTLLVFSVNTGYIEGLCSLKEKNALLFVIEENIIILL